jgi:hypothetical protein
MANISLKRLFEAEDFKAKSKETGKLVHFKSKDSYQAALKAGTHEDPKAQKGGASKGAPKPNDMFGGDYSKDRGGEPKVDSMATVKSIAAKTGLRATAVAGWADENGVNLSNLSADIDSKKLKPMDLMTAISGNPGNKYAKDIIAKYSQGGGSKSEPQTEPTAKPKEARKGNPTVNKEAKKKAEEFGITPQKLGKEGYVKSMYQAAVEALTDANFHDEARELVSKIEGKPEWAKRVNYPSMDDPKYKEKMADIRTNGVDSSEYWGGEDGTHEFGRKVSSASGWNGVEAADGIAFTLRMNGFHKEADMIQSVFDDKPYMKNEGRLSLSKMVNEDLYTHKTVLTENKRVINEAEKIKLGELSSTKQKQVEELQKLFGGKIITIWDSVHGNIVDIKVTEKNGRLIASDLKDLIALKIRWVEFDNQTVSIGF